LYYSVKENYLFHNIRIFVAQSQFFDKNGEQHNVFNSELYQFHEYTLTTKSNIDSNTKIQEIVNSFTLALQQHLVDEIEKLLALDNEILMKIHNDAEKTNEIFQLFFDKIYKKGIYNFLFVAFFML